MAEPTKPFTHLSSACTNFCIFRDPCAQTPYKFLHARLDVFSDVIFHLVVCTFKITGRFSLCALCVFDTDYWKSRKVKAQTSIFSPSSILFFCKWKLQIWINLSYLSVQAVQKRQLEGRGRRWTTQQQLIWNRAIYLHLLLRHCQETKNGEWTHRQILEQEVSREEYL